MIKREEGFALTELLVAVAITGIIFSVVGGVFYQLTTVSELGNDRLTALHQLENSGSWFVQDGQSAVSASAGPSLTFSLPDGGTIVYSLSGTDLQRTAGGSMIRVGESISGASFQVQGRLVSITLTAAPPGKK